MLQIHAIYLGRQLHASRFAEAVDVADREVADSGLCPSFGFVALRATTHSWPEGKKNMINPENGLRPQILEK